MTKALLIDFAFTLLFPKKQGYTGELNALHRSLAQNPNYDFMANFILNDPLIIFLTDLKEKYKIYMFTSGTIQDAPEISDKVNSLFERIFSAEEMMVSKKDPEAYKKIADMVDLAPKEILFIDDLAGNVQAARDAGMEAVQFKDNKSLMSYLDTLE
jgi:HAD superfamily hydrolase (TIGR01509 family)